MAKRKSRQVDNKYDNKVPNIVPKTENQANMLRSMIENQVTIASGSAGTGKSFLAAFRASVDYIEGRIDKIIVARPYRHMGKDAGAVPGSDEEKLYPFLRPILDNIEKFIGKGKFYNDFGKNIEVAPVEKIRGRSFDEPCAIIIDECQNTTKEQMKSIITRLGDRSSCYLCGDPSQSDIPGEHGLEWVTRFLESNPITDMEVVNFTSNDIVRGRMVKEFIIALERYDV